MTDTKTHRVTLIPGDGIGPEVTQAVVRILEATGVKCVWDYQHHWCFNPEDLPLVETLQRFCKTWPAGVRPKMHFSCARTEMRELKHAYQKGILAQRGIEY